MAEKKKAGKAMSYRGNPLPVAAMFFIWEISVQATLS